jgi:hypothetical protein
MHSDGGATFVKTFRGRAPKAATRTGNDNYAPGEILR